MIKCCLGCTPETGRSSTCHGTCKRYLGEKAAHEEKRKQERKNKQSTIQGYYSDRKALVHRRVAKYYGK